MKVATFNANSIRLRSQVAIEWVWEHNIDALLVQETKCEDGLFPVSEFEEAGLQVVFDGQKSYNGVAIISPHPIEQVRKGYGDPAWPDDKRILAATVQGIRLINTYVPNGTKVGSDKWTYKLGWLERFGALLDQEIATFGEVLWAGDINVAPTPLDVFDSPKMLGGVCHHPDEFSRLQALVGRGLTDLFRRFHPEGGKYSYFEFVVPRSVERNLGWRIDHIYATPSYADKALACDIDLEPRKQERPSDHTMVWAELDL